MRWAIHGNEPTTRDSIGDGDVTHETSMPSVCCKELLKHVNSEKLSFTKLNYILFLSCFRITRSDMNCQRVKYILRGLADNANIETLDFSHCKIGDEGASFIAKFISKRVKLRSLILVDNVFGKTLFIPSIK